MRRPTQILSPLPKPCVYTGRPGIGHLRQKLSGHVHRFRREEDGVLIIFGVFIFGLMLAIGGLSFDIMRYEANRMRLQATVDRASLAAASLTQSLNPRDVVDDYFAKAHMTDFLDSVTVTEGVGSRRVEVEASLSVPLHHGNFGVFATSPTSTENDTLLVEAYSVAEESIGNVEISLVLDVSGSMGSYSRLTNLKTAAKNFLDTVYDATDAEKVSTSIIPYSMQVNAGATLLSHYTRDNTHEHSHCINFSTSDYASTALSTTTPLEQTLHFDPWTTENGSFDLGNTLPDPACPLAASRQILPWSTNKGEMKDFIDDFYAGGNTSTDIGAKWGVALLDPGSQSILTSMVNSGDVADVIDGRPLAYDTQDGMKILVLMTDGAHTSQYYMDDYREGDSFVWKYVQSGVTHYSIWRYGENSTPIPDPPAGETVCVRWYWNGSCRRWETNEPDDNWFQARSYNGSYNSYSWDTTPYGGNDAVRMTWPEVWAEIPPEYFSDEVLYEMGTLSDSDRNAFEYAMTTHGQSTKDSRLSTLCTAAKSQGIIIFTVGLEVDDSNARKLENCASSVNHAFDVNGMDITNAFASIASQINQLRLVQ